jgi:hypothetical protein
MEALAGKRDLLEVVQRLRPGGGGANLLDRRH